MNSVCPQPAYQLHDVQRIGSPPTGIIGFGMRWVASPMRTPMPPQKMTTFIPAPNCSLEQACPVPRTLPATGGLSTRRWSRMGSER